MSEDEKWESKEMAYYDGFDVGYEFGWDHGRKNRVVWFWACCALSFATGLLFVRMG